jgi:AcrR family transcriptional regulator
MGLEEDRFPSSNGLGRHQRGDEDPWDSPPRDPPVDETLAGPSERVRELVRQIHRMWVVAATAKIANEAGLEALTLPGIATRAGLSQATVAELFGSADGCLAAAVEKAASVAAERTIPWFAAGVGSIERARIGVACLLGFCEQERELASLLVLRAPATAPQRDRMTRTLGRVLADEFDDAGAGGASDVDRATRAVERATEGLRAGLFEGARVPLEVLSYEILGTLLAPYLGDRAARIEAVRPVMPIASAPEPLMRRGERACLDVRLTAELLEELAVIWRESGS